jgi:hypothetical protein
MYAPHPSVAGVPLAQIAKRMGNSVKILLDHYILPIEGEQQLYDDGPGGILRRRGLSSNWRA